MSYIEIYPGEAEKMVREFFNAYLVRRDVEETLFWLTEEVNWIGTGKEEVVYCRENARAALVAEIAQDPEPYQIVIENIRKINMSPYCVGFFCDLQVKRRLGTGCLSVFEIRVSASCVKTSEGCRIAGIHASAPTAVQDEEEFYPVSFAEDKSVFFAERIGKGSLDLLGKNIPGGVISGYLEPGFPLYYINDRMLTYLGYDYKEFVKDIDGKVINGIHQEDRERVTKEVEQAFGEDQEYEVQYRMKKKDGSYICVKDIGKKIRTQDGRYVCLSVVRDISAEVEAERKLRLELKNRQLMVQLEARNEILKVALEHTSIYEFYYYPLTRVCVFPERTCGYYQCQEQYDRMPESFAKIFVVQEFQNTYIKIFDKIHQGEHTAGVEFKTVLGAWCRVIMSTMSYTQEGEPEFVVGIVEDISREKAMAEALEETKCRDRLTGLWNKEAGIRMTQEYLAQRPIGQHCVMMLLDMDNFTKVNEQEGIAFANAILQEVADILRSETKEEDLLIRLGGDEFMLLVKDCDKEQAVKVGPHIAEHVSGMLSGSELKITVSIGMCSTEVVEEYSGLYRCAESTLKYVKEKNRGIAACYLDTSNDLGVMLTNLYTENHKVNEIEQENADGGENMISVALELLGKAKNLEDAVLLLFARIGKTYQLDRVSLLEIDPGFLTCRFTYQWSRNKPKKIDKGVFYVTREEYEAALKNYDETGLCEKMEKQIYFYPSCLRAAIWDHGVYVGALAFEKNKENYVWDEDLKRLMAELGRIVPSFVMKARADAVSQAKTDFLSRMSHEIRTPMNAVVGMTVLARRFVDNKEKLLHCLDKLEESNRYLLKLINDILDMSRIESGKMELRREDIRISDLADCLYEMLGVQAQEKGVCLSVQNKYIADRPLMADELKLEQILVNIIGNAIKFTGPGGTVVFEILPLEETQQTVKLRFSVKDTGIGIAKEDLENIFNAFEQGKSRESSQYGGTGLGLAIANRLVQMMGGTIKVISERDSGSEFYFILSMPYGEMIADQHTLEDFTDFDFNGKRLLVVEDNEINLEIASEILTMNGFEVESAVNGLEAVELFGSHSPNYYDAVLMDIQMPVMDGIEATKQIRTMEREDSRTVPIIAMTANAFDEDSRKSLSNGMNGHLCKPVQVDEMLKLLQRCILQ